ncbi:Pertussis toxin liberation protein H [Kocuria rosea]|nr:Pertussis toxin liberation protein H [Kocuria rosea]
MKLAERLAAARGETLPPPSSAPAPPAPAAEGNVDSALSSATETGAAPGTSEDFPPAAEDAPSLSSLVLSAPPLEVPAEPASRAQVGKFDALAGLKHRVKQELLDRIGSRQSDSSLSDVQLKDFATKELTRIVAEEQVPMSSEERLRLIRSVSDDVLGYGPLQELLDDDSVTEIMVNGPDQIFIEQKGKVTLSESTFATEQDLRHVIEKIVTQVGRRIDESSPLVDARLPDGSRVNAVIPPLAVKGSSLTIRKFAKDPLTVEDLIRFGSVSPQMAELLRACVEAHLNILVAGGTGTGKTTMLNVMSSFIPHGERIVTIEDAVELQLQQEHVVQLESRPANIEGRGEITIRDLLKNSLRMRPDRIVVGECRGGEALDMLQAMNTGHDGSLSTIHANSPRDTISRLETLVMMAGMDLPQRAIREQIASAIHVVVQLSRLRDGTRRVTHITEIQGMEGETVTLQDAFLFDWDAGVDSRTGRFRGTTRSTGVRPRFVDKFEDYGIKLHPSVFDPGKR